MNSTPKHGPCSTTRDVRSLDITNIQLDPAYTPLSGSCVDLGKHWETDTPYTHPEFLHEVFLALPWNPHQIGRASCRERV